MYLFFIPNTIPPPPFPSDLLIDLLVPPFIGPLFLFRKVQVFYVYQQSMACQLIVRVSSFSCFKAVKGNPVWEIGLQK